jgi:hypothetical protein
MSYDIECHCVCGASIAVTEGYDPLYQTFKSDHERCLTLWRTQMQIRSGM